MTPTVEEPKPRHYFFLLENMSEEIAVKAEILCRPKKDNKFYQLKREGQVVAEFSKDEVISWRVADD